MSDGSQNGVPCTEVLGALSAGGAFGIGLLVIAAISIVAGW
jgi:hypothetical protein